MTETEAKYFKELHKQRKKLAEALNQPAARGAKDSVADQYSEQAHFIYELLQNADDAGATKVRFDLNLERLVFAHNGSRHFSISNPDTEDEDGKNGLLGDINAITSIGHSNKDVVSIGKFGVGFKSVFQYTDTPEIYDSNFTFKIEDFLVPVLLDEDYPNRRKNETVFVFPLRAKGKTSQELYDDISCKVNSLEYPVLFLSHLNQIMYETLDDEGYYAKRIEDSSKMYGTKVQLVSYVKNADEFLTEKIWLFSRGERGYNRYSVGFFLDEKNKLCPKDVYAFCFFSTREETGLNFIIHAPFLINQNREGLRSGNEHNTKMIENLAILAADAMSYFIEIEKKEHTRYLDDSILEIIPIKKTNSSIDKRDKVSFDPFFIAFQKKYQKFALLPAGNGYVSKQNAYWAENPQLPAVFLDKQLQGLVGNPKAKWVFSSIGRNEVFRNRKPLGDFIDSIVNTFIDEDTILNGRKASFYDSLSNRYVNSYQIPGITPQFLQKQKISWLINFYKWLSDKRTYIEGLENKPFYLDNEKKVSPIFDQNGNEELFLPIPGFSNYRMIHPQLLEDKSVERFLRDLGLSEPSRIDQIKKEILPMYKGYVAEIDSNKHFLLIFNAYLECSAVQVDEFIKTLSLCPFLSYNSANGDGFGKGATLYEPTPELKCYFSSKPDAKFVNIEKYQALVERNQIDKLQDFLKKLGVRRLVAVEKKDIEADAYKYYPDRYTELHRTYEICIDGVAEIIEEIEKTHNLNKSKLLWNALLDVIDSKCKKNRNFKTLMSVVCEYFYRQEHSLPYPGASSDYKLLTKKKWLASKGGKFYAPSQITQEDLSDCYDLNANTSKELMNSLGILKNEYTQFREKLSAKDQKDFDLLMKLKAEGFTEEDYQEWHMKKALRKQVKEESEKACEGNSLETKIYKEKFVEELTSLGLDTNAQSVLKKSFEKNNSVSKSTQKRYKSSKPFDSDDYTPHTIDYSEMIDDEVRRSVADINRNARTSLLRKQLVSAEKYSYKWFNLLLELESISEEQKSNKQGTVLIDFGVVQREMSTERTLILQNPSRWIPPNIEDMTDLPLVIHFGNKSQTLIIEVASVHSFTLRAKIRKTCDLTQIDFCQIYYASIQVTNPSFLLDSLRKGYLEMNLQDDYNLKKHLCRNIEFVFGPPGTGKTTHLANNVIRKLMDSSTNCRILVLTPTNKAADVLVERIIDSYNGDTCYEDWLVRFGGTGSERIEASPVFKEKNFDIRDIERCVTVTTIARFSYDYFSPEGEYVLLKALDWDYIVIDEASMISIAKIVYVLATKRPKKFIIAGDPFQIQPIATEPEWKNENIYTLVNLNSFEKPKTEPYPYYVEMLTTQYRSIPEVGHVFSNFAYNGRLRHYRGPDSKKNANLGNNEILSSLGIIKYPVSQYESIFRAKRLNNSSIHIYSALFIYEYVTDLAKKIAQNNPESNYSIGIISPYKSEVGIIEKLFQTRKPLSTVSVEVGTIHGFQGDECDIIFLVLNTPPEISDSTEMFLNNINIINVAISRARDSLFLVVPDDNTQDRNLLTLVNRLEEIMKSFVNCQVVNTSEVEKQLFGDAEYLKKNSFVTGHQTVNVYGVPEVKYEIRVDDKAVDVQLHDRIERVNGFYSDKKGIDESEVQNKEIEFSDEVPQQEKTSPDLAEEEMENSSIITPQFSPIECCDSEAIDAEQRKEESDGGEFPSIDEVIMSSSKSEGILELSKICDNTDEENVDGIASSEDDSNIKVIHITPGANVHQDISASLFLLSKKQRQAAFKATRLNKPMRDYWIVPTKSGAITGVEMNLGNLTVEIRGKKNEYQVWYSGLNRLVFIDYAKVTKEFQKAISEGFTLERIQEK